MNETVDIQLEAQDLALREERESCVVDVTKQTELSPNLNTEVVIPIHNPGSGALSGKYCSTITDWPKFAGFNIYSVQTRTSPLPQSKNNGNSYVSSDFYALKIDHHLQNADFQFSKPGQNDGKTPYTYPLRA